MCYVCTLISRVDHFLCTAAYMFANIRRMSISDVFLLYVTPCQHLLNILYSFFKNLTVMMPTDNNVIYCTMHSGWELNTQNHERM